MGEGEEYYSAEEDEPQGSGSDSSSEDEDEEEESGPQAKKNSGPVMIDLVSDDEEEGGQADKAPTPAPMTQSSQLTQPFDFKPSSGALTFNIGSSTSTQSSTQQAKAQLVSQAQELSSSTSPNFNSAFQFQSTLPKAPSHAATAPAVVETAAGTNATTATQINPAPSLAPSVGTAAGATTVGGNSKGDAEAADASHKKLEDIFQKLQRRELLSAAETQLLIENFRAVSSAVASESTTVTTAANRSGGGSGVQRVTFAESEGRSGWQTSPNPPSTTASHLGVQNRVGAGSTPHAHIAPVVTDVVSKQLLPIADKPNKVQRQQTPYYNSRMKRGVFEAGFDQATEDLSAASNGTDGAGTAPGAGSVAAAGTGKDDDGAAGDVLNTSYEEEGGGGSSARKRRSIGDGIRSAMGYLGYGDSYSNGLHRLPAPAVSTSLGVGAGVGGGVSPGRRESWAAPMGLPARALAGPGGSFSTGLHRYPMAPRMSTIGSGYPTGSSTSLNGAAYSASTALAMVPVSAGKGGVSTYTPAFKDSAARFAENSLLSLRSGAATSDSIAIARRRSGYISGSQTAVKPVAALSYMQRRKLERQSEQKNMAMVTRQILDTLAKSATPLEQERRRPVSINWDTSSNSASARGNSGSDNGAGSVGAGSSRQRTSWSGTGAAAAEGGGGEADKSGSIQQQQQQISAGVNAPRAGSGSDSVFLHSSVRKRSSPEHGFGDGADSGPKVRFGDSSTAGSSSMQSRQNAPPLKSILSTSASVSSSAMSDGGAGSGGVSFGAVTCNPPCHGRAE